MLQPTFSFEAKRKKAVTVVKCLFSNVSNILRNNYFLKCTLAKAALPDTFQLRAVLELNLAQALAQEKCTVPQCFNTAGNDYLFYIACHELAITNILKSIWNAKHCGVFLSESKLLPTCVHVRRKMQVGSSGFPEAEPAKFLNIFVQRNILQLRALPQSHHTNLFQ